MNVAITGVSGLLGAHLAAALSARHRVVGIDRHPWWGTRMIEVHQGDLGDPSVRREFIEQAKPDLLIHCAAMVNVDACEERPAEAYFVNGSLTGLIARSVAPHCLVAYVTTDGIFSGDTALQRETDLPCPRTVYGRSKLHGEWETQLATQNHLIVRTNFFGWSSGLKRTFAEWLYQALIDGRPITLFDDFWFTPIYVPQLVERILALVEGGHSGIFHIVGGERVSKYEFGMRLGKAAGFSTAAVRRGSIVDAPFAAQRPRDMSLSSEKVQATLRMPAPSCDEAIRRFLADRARCVEDRMRQAELTGIRIVAS